MSQPPGSERFQGCLTLRILGFSASSLSSSCCLPSGPRREGPCLCAGEACMAQQGISLQLHQPHGHSGHPAGLLPGTPCSTAPVKVEHLARDRNIAPTLQKDSALASCAWTCHSTWDGGAGAAYPLSASLLACQVGCRIRN